MRYFETRFLDEARNFIKTLDRKTAQKVFYNIDLAEQTNDSKLFKKLQKNIWEFRTNFSNTQIRLLAFWDRSGVQNTLVIATHGFTKKTDKVPGKEIQRAEQIRKRYFENKNQ